MFEDVVGKSTSITLHGLDPADAGIMAKMLALALSLRSYVNAAIPEYGVAVPVIQNVVGDNAALQTYESSLHKAIIRFSYVENNEAKQMALYVPAPNLAGFDFIQDVGYRMSSGTGETYRDAMRTATGIADLNFVNGVLEYIDGKSTRPGNGAYIQFQDIDDRFQFMGVPGVSDIAKLSALSTTLFQGTSLHSAAAVRQIGIITPNTAIRADTADTETGFDSVEGRAVLIFSYIDGTDKKPMRLTLPAMKKSSFAAVPGKKELPVLKVIGDAVALSLTAIYGAGVRTVKFESGERDIVKLKS